MKTKITFIFVFILSLSLSAQYYFAKEYGQFKTGLYFIETSDNGFLILTIDSNLVKIDSTGVLEWNIKFNSLPGFFHETSDSSFIVAYGQNLANSKFAVCKLDKNGDLIFAKSYLISEGYPVFSNCYGTYLKNDTLVAIVSENDSIINAYYISSADGDTINSFLLMNYGKRISSFLNSFHKNKYLYNEYFLYTRWYQTGTSTLEDFFVFYRFSNDLIMLDSTIISHFQLTMFSDINQNNVFLASNWGNLRLQFYDLLLPTMYLDTVYPHLDEGIGIIVNNVGSYYDNFLVSGRETRTLEDNIPKGMLCKVDENGNIIFRKQYTIDNHERAYFRYADFGDDYILAVGALQETINSPTKLFVVKTDLNGNVTSLPSHGLAANVRVYPNPATDILYVDMPKDAGGFAQYEIFDLQGRLLVRGRLHGNSIDVSGFSQGMYILTIETGGQRHSVKWVRE